MLARLPWGRRDMLGSMKGKHGGVHVKYVHCRRKEIVSGNFLSGIIFLRSQNPFSRKVGGGGAYLPWFLRHWCITNSLLPMDKSIHFCMIVKDNVKGQVTRRNVPVSWESAFKMLKNNICNTKFEVGQAFRELWGYISKTQWNISCSKMLEGTLTPDMITN